MRKELRKERRKLWLECPHKNLQAREDYYDTQLLIHGVKGLCKGKKLLTRTEFEKVAQALWTYSVKEQPLDWGCWGTGHRFEADGTAQEDGLGAGCTNKGRYQPWAPSPLPEPTICCMVCPRYDECVKKGEACGCRAGAEKKPETMIALKEWRKEWEKA